MISVGEFIKNYILKQTSMSNKQTQKYLDCYYKWIDQSNYYHNNNCYSPLIRELYDYFLWLLDLAIYYVRDFDYNDSSYEVSMYLKELFWNEDNKCANYEEVIDCIMNRLPNLNNELIFSGLLYPDYFFEKMNEGNSSDVMKNYLLKINDYEKILLFYGKKYLNQDKKNNAIIALFE